MSATLLQEIILPAREYLALSLEPAQVLRVIDVEGKQVLDLVGFGADREEKLSCLISNLLNNTWRLRRGHVLYTNRCRPMLAIVEDTVGVHPSGGGFCSVPARTLELSTGAKSGERLRPHSLEARPVWPAVRTRREFSPRSEINAGVG